MQKTTLLKVTAAMAVAALALDIFTIAIVHHHATHRAVAKVVEPCSTRQNLCIELDEADGGVVARFNDFRFAPDHCVLYRVLPPDAWQKYCGQYNLKWIGPETVKPTI